MSSSKRQKVEEYHDPDYCQQDTKVKATGSDSDRQDKIKVIIKREFLKEISSKEEEINLIDHKLNQTKRLLQRVRYAVAMSYYTKKNLVYSTNEVKCDSNAPDGISASVGQAIHPSLKKLLGKKPIDYEEILKNRSPRNAAKTARSTLIKPKKKKSAKLEKDTTSQMVKQKMIFVKIVFDFRSKILSIFAESSAVHFPNETRHSNRENQFIARSKSNEPPDCCGEHFEVYR